MKKTSIFLSAVFASITLGISSCNSSEEITQVSQVSLPESAKAPEVIAFQKALIDHVKNKSQLNLSETATDAKAKNTEALNNASKTFLLANGYSLEELQSKSAQDSKELYRMALALYAKKTQITTNN